MLTPEQAFVAVLAATTAASGTVVLVRAARHARARDDFDRRIAALLLLGAAAAVVMRMLLVEPILIHANFHGAALVDQILAFPRSAEHRAEYGQGSFVVLGALARLAGGGFEGVVAVNQVLAVATLVLLGVLAARLADRPWAAPLALLLGMLNPTLIRVAASEDAHVLATLLGATTLLALDVAARTRDHAALVCGTASALLLLWTRQTLYPVVALAIALALLRAGPVNRRWLPLRAALILIAVALAVRVIHTARHPTDAFTLRLLPMIAVHRFGMLFAGHPVLDPRTAPALLPLGILGLLALGRRPGGVMIAVGVVGLLVLTLPFALPAPGVELSFRMPAVALWLVPAAVGASALAGALRKPRAGALLVAALALLPPLRPAFAAARTTTAATEEMRALRLLGAALPSHSVVVIIPMREPSPIVNLPRFALPADAVVEHPDAPEGGAGPRFLLVGLQCRARSLVELVPGATLVQLMALDLRRDPGEGVVPPGELRRECRALLSKATLASPVVPIAAPDDAPFAFFGAAQAPVTVSLWKLAP